MSPMTAHSKCMLIYKYLWHWEHSKVFFPKWNTKDTSACLINNKALFDGDLDDSHSVMRQFPATVAKALPGLTCVWEWHCPVRSPLDIYYVINKSSSCCQSPSLSAPTISDAPNLASSPQPLKRSPSPTSNSPLQGVLGLRWDYDTYACVHAHTYTESSSFAIYIKLTGLHRIGFFIVCADSYIHLLSYKTIPMASLWEWSPIWRTLQAPAVDKSLGEH